MRVHTGSGPPTDGRWMSPFIFLENAAVKGIGTALYTVLFELLRIQGYFKAYAGITLPNPAELGFTSDSASSLVGFTSKSGTKPAPGMMFPGGD